MANYAAIITNRSRRLTRKPRASKEGTLVRWIIDNFRVERVRHNATYNRKLSNNRVDVAAVKPRAD